MSAKKRQDGRYQRKVKVSRPGDPPKYKYVYGTTIREVEAKKHDLIAQLGQGLDMETNPTIRFAIERWLEDKALRVRPQSLVNYNRALKPVIRVMGDRLVRDITITDARRIYRDVSADAPVQAARMVRFMTSVYKDEIDRAVVLKNPWSSVNLTRHESEGRRILTELELEKIQKADLCRRDRAIISTLRYTGVRKGELFALHVEDLDLDKGELHINKTTTSLHTVNAPKTKAGTRTIPMPEALCDDLRAYLEQHSGEGILFPNQRGGYCGDDSVYKIWRSIARIIFGGDAPDDFTPHLFRHTYAHDLVAHNVPVLTAMVVLGHDDMKTTIRTYSHFGYKEADTAAVLSVFQPGVK